MNHMLTPERRFATATLALADIKATSKKLGVTINDLVLAISAGALRKLLLRYDGQADQPLLASVPMSFDFSPDRISGNQFSGVLVALPVDVEDPLRAGAAGQGGGNPGQGGPPPARAGTGQPVGGLHPAGAGRVDVPVARRADGQNKVLNLNISNVPGPRERGRVGGALVTEIYSVGPLTAGSGVNITVWSYVDQLNISVLTDTATVDDPHEMTTAMVDEFIEIRRAAGLSEQLTVVETAMAPA